MVISQIQSPALRFRISDILHAFWLPEWGVHIACLSDSQPVYQTASELIIY